MTLRFEDTPAALALVQYFDRHHRELRKGALRGTSPLVDRAFVMRRAVVTDRFGADAAARPALDAIARWIEATGQARRGSIEAPLDSGDFECARGTPTCILRQPASLSCTTELAATDLLRQLVSHGRSRYVLDRVFARSHFAAGFLRYRTAARAGVPYIVGEDGRSIPHLSGVAHELGHCLHESSHGWSAFLGLVLSEASAHVFEELAVADYVRARFGLRSPERTAWHSYQRRVDLLNLHFFWLEHAELNDRDPPGEPLFEPQFYVFRESYFVLPGYQAVLAAATILRRAFLERFGPDMPCRAAGEMICSGELRSVARTCFPEGDPWM